MKKVLFTLNVDDYAPRIKELTYPLLKFHARKIGADFREITKRKWPQWPTVYEKLQIHELGRGYDWVLYFDADTLVHPDCIDFTNYFAPDTCGHNAQDFANIRFRYDKHFQEDGRNIGTCGWFVIAPASCIDLWRPTEQPLEEVLGNCYPIEMEVNSANCDRGHLVDDYVISRNIARFRLKHDTVKEILPRIKAPENGFFWHQYTIGNDEKVRQMKEILWQWKIPHPALAEGWDWLFDKKD